MTVNIDLTELARSAAEQAVAGVRAELPAIIDGALARREEKLQPLADCLLSASGKRLSHQAVANRLRRDPELRKLGLRVGRSVLFRRSAVESYYRARGGVA
jgi:hypothetical protein